MFLEFEQLTARTVMHERGKADYKVSVIIFTITSNYMNV